MTCPTRVKLNSLGVDKRYDDDFLRGNFCGVLAGNDQRRFDHWCRICPPKQRINYKGPCGLYPYRYPKGRDGETAILPNWFVKFDVPMTGSFSDTNRAVLKVGHMMTCLSEELIALVAGNRGKHNFLTYFPLRFFHSGKDVTAFYVSLCRVTRSTTSVWGIFAWIGSWTFMSCSLSIFRNLDARTVCR